jgi:hypothetical protein
MPAEIAGYSIFYNFFAPDERAVIITFGVY